MKDFYVTIENENGDKSIAIDPLDIDYMKADMFQTYLHMIDGNVYLVIEEQNKLTKRLGHYFTQRGITGEET